MNTAVEERTDEIAVDLTYGGQADFFFSQSRYPGLFGGAGGGKTFAGIHRAFEYAGMYPGARILCTEPRFRLVKQVLLPTIRQEFGFGEGSAWDLNKQDWEITVHNQHGPDSLIILSSALLMSPQMLSGLFLAAFWMDEIAVGDQEQTFRILQARLRQPGDFPYQGWVTGTPKGMNWVYHTWGPERKKAFDAFHVRTDQNPHLPKGYYDDLLDSYGDTPFARQELGGEFVAFQGLIYPQFSTGAGGHVQEPPDLSEFTRKVAGVDFSGGTSPSVLEAWGKLPSRKVCGLDEFYLPGCPIDTLIDAAGDMMQRLGITRFYSGPTEKENIERFQAAGLPISMAPVRDVNIGIKLVSSLYSNHSISLSSRQVHLITEKYQYQWREQRSTSEFLDEPLKANDHCNDAERYALTALIEPPTSRPVIAKTRIRV